MNKKNIYILPDWYKIGYQNYITYLDRKRICYKGKKITFQWSLNHFRNSIMLFGIKND